MRYYCPYTNQELNVSDTSSEHIIPLSLGGVNGLEIPVCIRRNSELGADIDAKIGNELIIKSARTKLGIKSQSGKEASMYFSNAKDGKTGLPLQANFTKDGIELNAPYIPNGAIPPRGETINLSTTSNLDIWLKYVAKTFLSAGYYAYGDEFRYNVDTNALRVIVDLSFDDWTTSHQQELKDVRAHHIYAEDTDDFMKLFRHICKAVDNASCIGLVPSSKGLCCFVGILGNYIGNVTVNANTEGFPREAEFEQGHFICVQDGKLVRVSFQRVLDKVLMPLHESKSC